VPRDRSGIHPNFNPLFDPGRAASAASVLDELMAIVPEAKSVRSHSLLQSNRSRLLREFAARGLTHDANMFLPFEATGLVAPWRDLSASCAFLNAGRAMSRSAPKACRRRRRRDENGVPVTIDFHPIHYFLNTAQLQDYESCRGRFAELAWRRPAAISRPCLLQLGNPCATRPIPASASIAWSRSDLRAPTPAARARDLYRRRLCWYDEVVLGLFVEAFEKLGQPGYRPEDQEMTGVAPLRCCPRRPEDAEIDWTSPAEEIARLVRASSRPFAGAFGSLEGKEKVTIWRAKPDFGAVKIVGVPGQIIERRDRGPLVVCGDGVLAIDEAERSGGKLPGSNRFRFCRRQP
jgi:polysaccharide deactylase WbmS-like protein/formyl transferase-like protein